MSADMCIHVRTSECTEEIMETFFKDCLGSKYFSWSSKKIKNLRIKHGM